MRGRQILLTTICVWFGASEMRATADFYLKVVDPSERALTNVTFSWRLGGTVDFGATRGAVGFSLNNMATGNGDTFYTLSQASSLQWEVSDRNNLANWKVWLDGARPNWGTLKVARAGYVPKEVRINASDGSAYWRRIELRVIPTISTGSEIDREDWVTPGVIPATVTDSRGVAVDGAIVRVTNEWGTLYTATTDPSGRANVTLRDPGRWTAVAEKSGYTSNTRTGANYPGDTTSGVSLTLTSTAIPSAPATMTATAVSSGQVNLSWSDVSGETLYRIQRRTGAGAFAAFTTNSANATTSSDTSVVAGTSYTYQVRAENASGNSSYTVSNTVTTPAASSPAPNPTPAPSPSPSSSSGGGGGAPSIWFLSALSLLGIARYFRTKR